MLDVAVWNPNADVGSAPLAAADAALMTSAAGQSGRLPRLRRDHVEEKTFPQRDASVPRSLLATVALRRRVLPSA